MGSTWLLAGLIALFTWPSLSTVPGPFLDESWYTALNMAADARLNFGTEIVFTYGPLGFLYQPQAAFAATAVIGAIYQVALGLALCFSLLWAARQSFPLPIAVLLAFVAAAITPHGEELAAIAFIWCAVALAPSPPEFARPLVIYGGAGASAIALLFKLNTGVTVLILVAVAVVALEGDRRRNLLTFAGTLLGSLTILWFAAGQGIGNITDYVSTAVEVTSGHSQAMTIELPEVSWYRAVAVLEILAAVGAAAYAGLGLPRFRLAALVAITALFVFAQFKSGLVRNDHVHAQRFFAAMLIPMLAFRWSGIERATAAGAICAMAALFFPLTDRRPKDVFNPIDSADAAVTDLRTLLDPAERSRARDEARQRLQGVYAEDPETLALVRGESVHVYPAETPLVWAYGLDWRPLPIFQSYVAYTSDLDERNAEALASDQGPSRIVWDLELGSPSSFSIDGRSAAFEAPAQTLAMFCNYEPLRTTDDVQVLAKAEDRCGEPVPIGTVEAGYGETIPVPRAPGPDSFVAATVEGLEPQGIERLRTLVYRSAPRYITINGAGAFRLVPGTADDLGLILRAPPGVDYPAPFAISPDARTIQLTKDPEVLSSSGDLQVEFFAIRARASWR